jgi:hypothetical protein
MARRKIVSGISELYAILGDTLQPTNPMTKTIILTKINDNKFLPLQPI